MSIKNLLNIAKYMNFTTFMLSMQLNKFIINFEFPIL